MRRFAVLTPLIAFCAGCSSVRSNYWPQTSLVFPPKRSANEVEVLITPPSRAVFDIGHIGLGGNMRASYDDLIKEARKKAAEKGADVILIVKATSEKQNISLPGYSSFSGYGSGSGGMYSYSANGYSVGPSEMTVDLPGMLIFAGVYCPARLGIYWEREKLPTLIVKDFDLHSYAPEAGMKIGDVVIGVDGIDSHDRSLQEHIFEIQPSQVVHLVILRNGERLSIDVEAMPNLSAAAVDTHSQPDTSVASTKLKPDEEVQVDDAVAAYRQSIKLHPLFREALRDSPPVYGDQEYDHAVATCQQAIKLKPDDPNVWFQLGVVYEDKGKDGDAVAAYRQAIKLKPDFVGAWVSLGRSYSDQGTNDEAVAAFHRVTELRPNDSDSWYFLGVSYSDQGKNDDAIAALRQAIKLKPDNSDAWHYLGLAYGKHGKKSEALDALDHLRKLDPSQAAKLADLLSRQGITAQ